jgi:vesicle coat complex subunit
MYLKKPDDCEDLVMNILRISTEESDNPDLRDRGYIYWRMLSTDPASTKFVVLSDKPEYQLDEQDNYGDDFLKNLIVNISNLSSVYHITPYDIETPQRDQRIAAAKAEEEKKREESKRKAASDDEDEAEDSEEEEEVEKPKESKKQAKQPQKIEPEP